MKNITVPVAVAIAIVGCVLAVNASVNMGQMDQKLAKERFARLAAEQNLQQAQKLIQQQAAEITDARQKIGNIESIINQGKTTASELKAQLDREVKDKAAMAAQLQQLQSQMINLQAGQMPGSAEAPAN